jgi:hypothetical protein
MKKFKKFKDFDDDFYESEEREDRRHRLSEKRMRQALRARNVDELINIEDDYI